MPNRLNQIEDLFRKNHYPSFRLAQIKRAIFLDPLTTYSSITTLPKQLKEDLITSLGSDEILSLKKVHEHMGKQAHKVLFETRDGHQIEAVYLTYHLKQTGTEKLHHSLCISTQSGCALGCLFCATGAIGFKKNLTSDEILDQVLYFTKAGFPLDSVIFMGMGEPLSNPENTFAAIDMLTAPDLLALSQRRLSLSTVGIVPGIRHLTTNYPNVNLAFSLHNPFDDERTRLMPITKAYPITKVFEAIDNHLEKTNHKVFIAYILLKGVNDSERHAKALATLVTANPRRTRLLHVNLIRYNPGESLTVYKKPSSKTVENFQEILTKARVHHTLRADFGTDIKAACGQLAANYLKSPNR